MLPVITSDGSVTCSRQVPLVKQPSFFGVCKINFDSLLRSISAENGIVPCFETEEDSVQRYRSKSSVA